jgi:hypothetical protein
MLNLAERPVFSLAELEIFSAPLCTLNPAPGLPLIARRWPRRVLPHLGILWKLNLVAPPLRE